MANWDKEFTGGKWKKKRVTIINPKNQEELADVWATPTDFTRRSFATKITKWHAQYPKDKDIAEYWYGRLLGGGIGSLLSHGDEKHIQIVRRKRKT